ncbi:hypothetical protein [Parasporobacterium paucivorans]|uniref:Alcohol acetyltransferase n=1 Tax=Parasporobacterium paucivorans DSM 15970 TaxID=1122934 RepID=A0A1M6JBZ4_9FIRM|nr:hypothetical protein [Parasporobacterium paucivorans]SHJ44225.1 hypothetical protein SAMN02745691_01972 [Parasporobacterium paucivorans DSM 15970]
MRKKVRKRHKETKWYKLDNTANIFPVITNESMANVYRLSVTLKEEINPELLQTALDEILPWFNVFRVRLRRGIFWYYFETNHKDAPKVAEEVDFPCRYIDSNSNNHYMFRVTYYKNRINLEVFHVLTDGMGGFNFLKELTYQYLRLSHPELVDTVSDTLCSDTSLDDEDSYLKNYKKSAQKQYKTEKAFIIKDEKLNPMEMGVFHGYINIPQLKEECKKMGVSINQFLVGTLIWSVYKEALHESPSEKAINICVPVNLRPYFDSITTRNFFAVLSASFKPGKENYTYEEVMMEVAADLKSQTNKENLEKLFSYNVANEKRIIVRAVPLFIKNIAIKAVFRASARANTATLTNMGSVDIRDEYEGFIEKFHVILSVSARQNLKCAVCSYNETLAFSFSSYLSGTSIQKTFFRKISEKGINVSIESNGVYYE